jgi:hypothetical protein
VLENEAQMSATTKTMMKAICIGENSNNSTRPYSDTNPAPASALVLDENIPIPQITRPGELLTRMYASTVVRDELM